MLRFLASLIVSMLLTVYIILSYYLISMANSVSTLFGIVVFVIVLAVAIDFLTMVNENDSNRK